MPLSLCSLPYLAGSEGPAAVFKKGEGILRFRIVPFNSGTFFVPSGICRKPILAALHLHLIYCSLSLFA
jgi:hypothetical protein